VVPHYMDVIPWTLLGGVNGDASSIGLNSMNLGVRVHGGVVPQYKDVIPRGYRGGASI